MTFKGMRLEYAFEGRYNFIEWKDHMEVVVDDNCLLEYMTNVSKPLAFDAQNLAQWKKDVAKVRRIISWRECETTLSKIFRGKKNLLECGRH